MANERLDRFTKLLKEIFELDKSDLDFGIYRVMNLRKTEIENFLINRLPQMVQETLAPFARGSREEIRAEMVQIEENVAGIIDTLQEIRQFMGDDVDAFTNLSSAVGTYDGDKDSISEDLADLRSTVEAREEDYLSPFFGTATITTGTDDLAGILTRIGNNETKLGSVATFTKNGTGTASYYTTSSIGADTGVTTLIIDCN